jgi:hypothetical protein
MDVEISEGARRCSAGPAVSEEEEQEQMVLADQPQPCDSFLTFILTFLERKKLTDCAKATKDV